MLFSPNLWCSITHELCIFNNVWNIMSMNLSSWHKKMSLLGKHLEIPEQKIVSHIIGKTKTYMFIISPPYTDVLFCNKMAQNTRSDTIMKNFKTAYYRSNFTLEIKMECSTIKFIKCFLYGLAILFHTF